MQNDAKVPTEQRALLSAASTDVAAAAIDEEAQLVTSDTVPASSTTGIDENISFPTGEPTTEPPETDFELIKQQLIASDSAGTQMTTVLSPLQPGGIGGGTEVSEVAFPSVCGEVDSDGEEEERDLEIRCASELLLQPFQPPIHVPQSPFSYYGTPHRILHLPHS